MMEALGMRLEEVQEDTAVVVVEGGLDRRSSGVEDRRKVAVDRVVGWESRIAGEPAVALGHRMTEESCRTEEAVIGGGAGFDRRDRGSVVDVEAGFGHSWEWHQMHHLAGRMLVVLDHCSLLGTSCYYCSRSYSPVKTDVHFHQTCLLFDPSNHHLRHVAGYLSPNSWCCGCCYPPSSLHPTSFLQERPQYHQYHCYFVHHYGSIRLQGKNLPFRQGHCFLRFASSYRP